MYIWQLLVTASDQQIFKHVFSENSFAIGC
jgi:hypothetical protein